MARIDVSKQGSVTLLPSVARTADTTSDEFVVGTARGCIVVIDSTAISATPSVTFTVRGVDPTSGKTWNILTSAAVSTVTTIVLRIHPELTASANLIAKDMVPPIVQVFADHGDADSITYSVSLHLAL